MYIKQTCECVWCGGTMTKRGETIIHGNGGCFAYWCNNCGAVTYHEKVDGKEITSIEVDVTTVNMSQEEREARNSKLYSGALCDSDTGKKICDVNEIKTIDI